MFDLDWGKLALIGAIALIVIGPKDLPKALRTVGFWVRKARSMASEFQSSVEQMAREAELQELREKVEKASRLDVEGEIRKAVDPDNKIADALTPPNLPDPAAIIAEPFQQPTSPTPEPPIVGADYPTSPPSVAELAPVVIEAQPVVQAAAQPTTQPAAQPEPAPPAEPVAAPAPKQV